MESCLPPEKYPSCNSTSTNNWCRMLRLFSLVSSCSAILLFSPPANAQQQEPDRPIEQVIDFYIGQRLQTENITPAPTATDANLIRRTMLDLVGRIPTAAEAQTYINSAETDKRIKLVDHLLADPAYIRHQATEFDAMLMHESGRSLRTYLLEAFAENRPWDRMFREMLLGVESDKEQNGAIQFVRARVGDLDKLANETSVLFFGVNVSCAKCHDHPLVPNWTQDHFYGMKSFFSRTFENGGFIGERDYGLVKYKTTEGEERTAKLMFLSGAELAEPESKDPTDEEKKAENQRLEELKKNKQPPAAPTFSRRLQLVETSLQQNENGFFPRAIVNRLWYRLLGHGLVMPLDQMHSENEPSHPELLGWLARDLVQHNYDLKRLIRGIVLSDTYARSSIWSAAGDRPEPELFAVANVRPLTPQQYAMTLRMASMHPDQFAATLSPDDFSKRVESAEGSARGFANQFEQPSDGFRIATDEALLLSNNERFNQEFLRDDGGSLIGKLKTIEDKRQLVETAIWNTWTRPPEEEETNLLVSFLEKRTDRPQDGIKWLTWTLLTSSECRFNY